MAVGYVTVKEADTYVTTHYVSSDPLRDSWSQLTYDDKGILLLNSFKELESLPFHGRKYSLTQLTAFPRYPDPVVPQAVKDAQCAYAILMSDSSMREDISFYDRLRRVGVRSYRLGNMSETLTDTPPTQEIARLLAPYLRGGYRIG